MHKYSGTQAKAFSELGIKGATTEPSFKCAARIFGNSLKGKVVLDFGCGTGRSTMFVEALGARFIIGVDANASMIRQAKKVHHEHGVSFYKITNHIPFKHNHFDAAFTAHVIVESKTKLEMRAMLSEISRVLKPGTKLIIITSNPMAVGHDYKVGYTKKRKGLKSGDRVDTIIKGTHPFIIKDTYWTEKDYRSAISQSGFRLIKAFYPLARGKGWLDETKVAPNLVYKCVKIPTK